MIDSNRLTVTWTKVGVVTGILTFIVYPLIIVVPMPEAITVALAAAFGPLLSVACLGLYFFISAYRNTVSLQIAAVFTVIAGSLLNTMLVVQMTVRDFMRAEMAGAAGVEEEQLVQTAYLATDKVQLGLDISMDFYLTLGTILFAMNMLRHPRLGRVIGSLGVVAGASLLCFNLYTFPVPPAEGGSVDLGPLLGLWYFVVAIMMARSVGWLKNQEPQQA
jgi:hypothetical protein